MDRALRDAVAARDGGGQQCAAQRRAAQRLRPSGPATCASTRCRPPAPPSRTRGGSRPVACGSPARGRRKPSPICAACRRRNAPPSSPRSMPWPATACGCSVSPVPRRLGQAGGTDALPPHLASVSAGVAGWSGSPIRCAPGWREAVAEARAAGIRVVMLTGDHPETARAIARRPGISTEPTSCSGRELDALDGAELCVGGLARAAVFRPRACRNTSCAWSRRSRPTARSSP